MMRRFLLAIWLALALPDPAQAQETVVTGLSADRIALNATFDGSELFVFGAVRRDGPPPADAGPLDIIITIKGPPSAVTVRRKTRVLGIWMNTQSVRVRGAPSFYAIATTRPLDEILSETERLHYNIGMDQAVRRVGPHVALADTRPFAHAVVRLRRQNGLYAQINGGVSLAEETLFQTRFDLPANITEGIYTAEFFLVRNGEVISADATAITVRKTGVERWIFNLSQEQPLLYGCFAVLVALAAGWLAAAGFRLVRR